MGDDSGFSVADFYNRSDGDILLLRTPSVSSIELLQAMFTRLAQNPGLRLDLSTEIGMPIGGVGEVIAECDERIGDFDKAIHIKKRRDGLPTLHWRRGPSGWQWCAELMQPLIDGGRAGKGQGHQYLAQSSVDDADIEVDFDPASGTA
jgi:hypothetical protein